MPMKFLRIGEVARQAEVGVETIRYYEREGLLAEPSRRPSGYRQYDATVVARLRFIRSTKELGFTLAEIRELLELRFDLKTRCEHVRARAEQKITDIEERIRSLHRMKRSLRSIVSQCEQKDTVTDCPLWSGLDPHGQSENDGPSASE